MYEQNENTNVMSLAQGMLHKPAQRPAGKGSVNYQVLDRGMISSSFRLDRCHQRNGDSWIAGKESQKKYLHTLGKVNLPLTALPYANQHFSTAVPQL